MPDLMTRRKTLVDSMMRDAIYQGAVTVLAEHGLHGATMDRVAAAAGVAKGSLYNYFRSKDELLTFVHEKTIQPLIEANEQIAASDQSAAAKIEAMTRNWYRYVGEHRATFQILVANMNIEGVLREASIRRQRASVETIAGIIRQGVESGEFRSVNAKYVAEMLLAGAKGMMEAEFIEGSQRSEEEMTRTLLAVFLRGLCTG